MAGTSWKARARELEATVEMLRRNGGMTDNEVDAMLEDMAAEAGKNDMMLAGAEYIVVENPEDLDIRYSIKDQIQSGKLRVVSKS